MISFYKVEVNAAKEQEFLQLLRAWQRLNVVEQFSTIKEFKELSDAEPQYVPAWEKLNKKLSQEQGKEYHDLID